MARTIIEFKNTDKNLFEISDKWAKIHKFKTIKSSKSGRLYRKRQQIISPVQIFIPTKHKVKISQNSDVVSIECWIDSPIVGDMGISSSLGFQPLGTKIFKKTLREYLNDLLIKLNQEDKLVH